MNLGSGWTFKWKPVSPLDQLPQTCHEIDGKHHVNTMFYHHFSHLKGLKVMTIRGHSAEGHAQRSCCGPRLGHSDFFFQETDGFCLMVTYNIILINI